MLFLLFDLYYSVRCFREENPAYSGWENFHSPYIPELEQVEASFKAQTKGNGNEKTVNDGNCVSINTENVIYIENGPDYHTYTFKITREGSPENAHLENLVLNSVTDGTYRELLFTYNIIPAEKKSIANGIPINTEDKVSVT